MPDEPTILKCEEMLAALDRYHTQVDAIAGTATLVHRVLEDEYKTARNSLAKALRIARKYFRATTERDYSLFHVVDRRRRKLHQIRHSRILWLRSQLILLVSQFEAYLSRTIHSIIDAKPEIINGSDRKFTFAQLKDFGTIEDARSAAINGEVEAVMRLPRPEKFKWLERHIGLKLEKEAELWRRFVEITERRHCLAHSDGEVTLQYLANCKEVDVIWATDKNITPAIGSYLPVSRSYLGYACSTFYEMATKVTHFVSRLLFKDELPTLDQHLNAKCIFECLTRKNHQLAKTLSKFALGLPRPSSQGTTLMYTVNLAIALKHLGETSEYEKLLSGKEWDVYEDRFKLAHAALSENITEVMRLIKKIGKSDDPGKHAYRTWPLFHWVRTSEEFKVTFQSVYGEPLVPPNVE